MLLLRLAGSSLINSQGLPALQLLQLPSQIN